MHLKFYGGDSTNHFHLLLYANLRWQSSTFDSTWNSTFVYHIFSISGSKISIVGVFERSHLPRSIFGANFRFDFLFVASSSSSSLHTHVHTLWELRRTCCGTIAQARTAILDQSIWDCASEWDPISRPHIVDRQKVDPSWLLPQFSQREDWRRISDGEGGNRENPFREIVLSRLNASVTPECLLFQNSILKTKKKSSKIEMTFQNQMKSYTAQIVPLFVKIQNLKKC